MLPFQAQPKYLKGFESGFGGESGGDSGSRGGVKELEFEDNIKFRSTLKDPVVFDPTVEGDSRLPKVTTELGSGEEKMVTEFREGEPKDVSPTDPSNLQNLEKPVVEQMQKLVFGAPNNSPKPAPSSDHEATLVGETKVKKRHG